MIRINLVPGAKRARREGGLGVADAVAYVQGLGARVRDPYLAAAVVSVLIAVLFTGGGYLRQTARKNALAERQATASADSARYSVIVRERASAVASRDSTRRQLRIIRSIDDNRFVWPHVLDEVSRALPPYTWLTTLEQTIVPVAPAAPAPNAGAKGAAATPDTVRSPPPRVHLVGITVDIQALTRFMKDLEASPFIENVTLNKSDLIVVDDKEVTRFELDCDYQAPEPMAISTVPASLQAR